MINGTFLTKRRLNENETKFRRNQWINFIILIPLTMIIGAYFPNQKILENLGTYNYFQRTILIFLSGITYRLKYYAGFVLANLHASYC
jgi:hypothetical protein